MVQLNDSADENKNGSSNIVYVIPPTDPEVKKTVKVNDPSKPAAEHLEAVSAGDLDKGFNYTVPAEMPYNIENFDSLELIDDVPEVFAFTAEDITIKVGTTVSDLFEIAPIENNQVKATLKASTDPDNARANLNALRGMPVIIDIVVTLDPDQYLKDYLVDGKLSNTAKLVINNMTQYKSNQATIEPATFSVEIKKDFDGAEWPAESTELTAVFALDKTGWNGRG